jgi:hypothetical protein
MGVILVSVAALWTAAPALSDSTPPTAPSKEMREKMATVHEQMAACLRSDKSIDDCRTAMMKSCHETIGPQGCQMMGKGRGQKTPPANATK